MHIFRRIAFRGPGYGRHRSEFTRITVGLLALLGLAVVLLRPAMAGADPGTFYDGFDGSSLDAGWTVRDGYAELDPGDVANHASFSVADSHLTIGIPGGSEHNMWWQAHAQVHRPYAGSAVYELKLNSDLTGDQQFGLVFESTPGTFLIFMLYANGDIWGYVERFVYADGVQYKSTYPGSSYQGHNTGLHIPHAGPYYLRVVVDDSGEPSQRHWRFQWSQDGLTWTTAAIGELEGSEPHENIGAIQHVGLFAGNQPYTFSSFEARFDEFRYYPISQLPIAVPGGLMATAGDGSVTLTWNAVDEAEEYAVYRALSPEGPYTPAGITTATEYLDVPLPNGTTQYYTVATRISTGQEGQASAPVAAMPSEPPVPPEIPSELPAGLVLYLDADHLATYQAAGSPVTSWLDGSPAAHHASADSSSAPTLAQDAIGGHFALAFDGSNDFLSLVPGFSDFSQGASIFVVAQPTSLSQGSKLLLLGNGAGQANLSFGQNGASSGLQYFTTSPWGAFGWFGTPDALAPGLPSILSVAQGPAAPGASVSASVSHNGLELASGSVFGPDITTRASNFIGKSYWSADANFHGHIAQVIVYNRLLSPEESAAVLTFLATRYSIE
jgi:hypothetical protein